MDFRKLGGLQRLMRRLVARIDEVEQLNEMQYGNIGDDVASEIAKLGFNKVPKLGPGRDGERQEYLEYPGSLQQVASRRLHEARDLAFSEAMEILEKDIAELVVKVRNEVLNAAPIDSVVVSDVPADVSKRILAALETEVPQTVSVPRDSSEHPGDGYRWVEVGETVIVGDQWLIHGHYVHVSGAVLGTVNQGSKQLRRKVFTAASMQIGDQDVQLKSATISDGDKVLFDWKEPAIIGASFGAWDESQVEVVKLHADEQMSNVINANPEMLEEYTSPNRVQFGKGEVVRRSPEQCVVDGLQRIATVREEMKSALRPDLLSVPASSVREWSRKLLYARSDFRAAMSGDRCHGNPDGFSEVIHRQECHSSEPRKLYISRETIDETVNKLRAFAESCTTYDSAELIEFASQLVGMLPANGITPE